MKENAFNEKNKMLLKYHFKTVFFLYICQFMSNNYKKTYNMLTLIFFKYIIENIVYKQISDLCIISYDRL